MEVAVSSSHIVSAAPSSSGGGLLTLFPCSSMGSLPGQTVLHEFLQHGSFPWATVLHKLFQHVVPSMGCSPSGTDCSSVGSPWGHKSCQETFSIVGSSLHGSTGPGRSLIQHRLPTGSQPPSGIHLMRHGVFPRLQVDICSTMHLHGLQGDSLPHHGLLHRLQGNLCSGTWSTSSPSFFTDLGFCRVVSLTYSHSSLLLQVLFHSDFFPLS